MPWSNLEEEEPEEDEKRLAKLEEYARVRIELDRKFGSISLGQIIMLAVVFLVKLERMRGT